MTTMTTIYDLPYDIIFHIKKFVNINNLLNTTKYFLTEKEELSEYKLNFVNTIKYYNGLILKNINPKNIKLNFNIKQITKYELFKLLRIYIIEIIRSKFDIDNKTGICVKKYSDIYVESDFKINITRHIFLDDSYYEDYSVYIRCKIKNYYIGTGMYIGMNDLNDLNDNKRITHKKSDIQCTFKNKINILKIY